MNLINVSIARSVWLFALEELNRGGVRLYPTVADAVTDRYDFDEIPEGEYKPDKGLALKNGQFAASNNRPILVNLQVYNDGLVAETSSSTSDSDAFLEDVLKWLVAEFGMNYHATLIKKKIHYSELGVHSTVDLSVCEKLKSFATHLYGLPLFGEPPAAHQEVGAISFWADGKAQASFSFERKIGVAFSENRYYSRAALSTDEHLKLIEKFETILAAP